ncbi:MAG TPA: hypothetical protein VFQ61_33905 [Polyangiaceae bacterium]|nr:hypothetical protein [Polyangiaceae bacterium]
MRLHEVQGLAFVTWPKEDSAAPQVLHDITAIFVPPLGVLSGEARGEGVEVVCNQPSPLTEHCGGTLSFRATAAQVSDQNGNLHSLESLASVADAYWKDWSARTPKS